jgi:hypothetical protein
LVSRTAHRPADQFDEVFTEMLRLLVDGGRVRARELDAGFAAAVQGQVAAYIEGARGRGDALMVGIASAVYADSLAFGGSSSDAVAAATEACTIGEALGAGWIAAARNRSMADALTAMAVSGTSDRAAAAREIRRVIIESRDRHTMLTAFWALDPLMALLWDYDPRTVYLLRLANRRTWPTGTPLPANAVDALGVATVAELEERANAMNADQILALALETLDRYLVAVDPR